MRSVPRGKSVFGGMAGCALIGQSVVHVRSAGRGRHSMFSVAFDTTDWKSLGRMRVLPMTESIVLIATVTTAS